MRGNRWHDPCAPRLLGKGGNAHTDAETQNAFDDYYTQRQTTEHGASPTRRAAGRETWRGVNARRDVERASLQRPRRDSNSVTFWKGRTRSQRAGCGCRRLRGKEGNVSLRTCPNPQNAQHMNRVRWVTRTWPCGLTHCSACPARPGDVGTPLSAPRCAPKAELDHEVCLKRGPAGSPAASHQTSEPARRRRALTRLLARDRHAAPPRREPSSPLGRALERRYANPALTVSC